MERIFADRCRWAQVGSGACVTLPHQGSPGDSFKTLAGRCGQPAGQLPAIGRAAGRARRRHRVINPFLALSSSHISILD